MGAQISFGDRCLAASGSFGSAALLLCALAACQEYTFVGKTNQRIGGRTYEVGIEAEGKTDILFVIDNSGSMAEEQQKLKDNMAAFVEVLTRSVNDYQVGIISTDIARVPRLEGCAPCCDLDTDGDGLPDWSDCDAGRLIAADGRTRFFTRPRAEDTAELEKEKRKLIDGFNANITALGANGSAYEASFDAVKRTLDPQADVAVRALNSGFIRADADLAIIFLTDEDDCSFDSPWYLAPNRDDADCYVDQANAVPPSAYLDFFAAVKGDIGKVRAAAIVGSVPNSDLSHPLGFAAAGCFTIEDSAAANVGEPSNACGCWSARYLPDRRPDQTGDYYCNLMSEPPYSQLPTRVPDAGNNQGGCLTLPGSRYVAFLEELAATRQALGYDPGVLTDSICRADYRETLEKIAIAVVLSDCFKLKETPAPDVADGIIVYRNGQKLSRVEPHSGSPGWTYDASTNSVCLEGGVTKEIGDVFEITVIHEASGF
jgi:hypothetical protein